MEEAEEGEGEEEGEVAPSFLGVCVCVVSVWIDG